MGCVPERRGHKVHMLTCLARTSSKLVSQSNKEVDNALQSCLVPMLGNTNPELEV